MQLMPLNYYQQTLDKMYRVLWYDLSPPDLNITFLPQLMRLLSTGFRENLLSRFCVILLTNKQSNADENRTSSVEVIIMISIFIWRKLPELQMQKYTGIHVCHVMYMCLFYSVTQNIWKPGSTTLCLLLAILLQLLSWTHSVKK